MLDTMSSRFRIRKSFGQLREVVDLPDLIEVQKSSFRDFLQKEVEPDKRTNTGLQAVFKSIYPIKDFSGKAELDFLYYELGKPEYDVEECKYRGLSYAIPLKAAFRLVIWEIDEATGAKSIKDIKEQLVYLGDLPDMTENGTFVINGIERVIVSQMHRSPGVFFDHDGGKATTSGKILHSARVIPYRGSWLDFEFDAKDTIFVRVDRKRKIPVTTFLMCLDNKETEELRKKHEIDPYTQSEGLPFEVKGLSTQDILNYFYEIEPYSLEKQGWKVPFNAEHYRNLKLEYDLIDAATGKVFFENGTKITPRKLNQLKKENPVKEIIKPMDTIMGKFLARDYVNKKTGEVVASAGDEIDEALLESLIALKEKSIDVLDIDNINRGPHIRNTLMADKNRDRESALIEFHKLLRPGEPPKLDSAEMLFKGLFFDIEKYDLSSVGRVKINSRVGSTALDTFTTLQGDDILRIVKTLVELRDGRGYIDDIDNLSNRRIRAVGELLENQCRLGLVRMERTVRERMINNDLSSIVPNDLINAKPAMAAIKEFFCSSQLSQFMDQTNPLSEVTHKRRLSALGPGGLSRERAGFEVRDVHPTHYGRICPIETPEGQNIGLINSLATYARVSKYGFIETPYRRVVDGNVTSEIVYLSAMDEWECTIAQASSKVDEQGNLVNDSVSARCQGEVC